MMKSLLPEFASRDRKVLELGNYPWAALIRPHHTDFIFCGSKKHDTLVNLTPKLAWELRQRLRKGYYQILIWSLYYPKSTFWPEHRSRISNAWIFARSALRQFQDIGRELIPWLLKDTGVPLVVVDRKDEPPLITPGEFPLLKLCKAYFHRECPIQPYASFYGTSRRFGDSANIKRSRWLPQLFEKIYPISLGCNSIPDFTPSHEKKTDVFFAGAVEHSEARIRGLDVLKRLEKEGYAIDTPGYLHDRREFLKRASEAYLVLSPQGLGWDCYRHYEAGYVGSVPVMNYPTIRRYAPLEDRTHAFYYGIEGDHLYRVLKQALSDKPKLISMGKNARAHVLKYHTWERLWGYVMQSASLSIE